MTALSPAAKKLFAFIRSEPEWAQQALLDYFERGHYSPGFGWGFSCAFADGFADGVMDGRFIWQGEGAR